MDWKENVRNRLYYSFKDSFFNSNDEFIAHKYSNTYFILSNCKTEEDVNCKILEWFSRPDSKGMPYFQEWRNVKFRKFMLDGINDFLHTNFSQDDISEIYQYLGNAINHNKTLEFVRNNYDMNVLNKENKQ